MASVRVIGVALKTDSETRSLRLSRPERRRVEGFFNAAEDIAEKLGSIAENDVLRVGVRIEAIHDCLCLNVCVYLLE